MTQQQYIFGPVPSRRLGFSLGIDVVPFKQCSMNCVYCELGPTTELTDHINADCPVQPILAEVSEALLKGKPIETITVCGSGEPTLYPDLAKLVDGLHELTAIPVALITNGSLFSQPSVRHAVQGFDMILPSLDSAREETFRRVNRPHHNIHVNDVISGLINLRTSYVGQLWLEVFVVKDINDTDEDVVALKDAISLIRPDKVHLNTLTRPAAYPGVEPVSKMSLMSIAAELGPIAEIITPFDGTEAHLDPLEVLNAIRRRPCTVDDVAHMTGSTDSAVSLLNNLIKRESVESRRVNGDVYYCVTR